MLKSPGAPLAGHHADPADDVHAEPKGEAPRQGRWQNSLQRRMLFVYFLVGLLPMFLAAELASQVVTHAFESNLRTWLRETAIYFVSSVVDSEREASEVGGVLAQQTDLLGGLISGSAPLPTLEKSMLAAEGFDLLAVADEQGRIVYSSIPIREQHPLYLGRNISFTAIRTDSENQLLVSSSNGFDYKGHRYQVLLGSWLDVSFFGNLSAITSFDFRLYMAPPDARSGAGFKQIFRSGTHGESSSQLRADIVSALRAPDSEYFDRHVDDDDAYTGIYLPLLDDKGVLKGVVFCGLRSGLSATRWVSRTNVFLIIFLTGTILSVMIGYAVSRRLTRPLRLLANSVRAITAGNYRSRVTAEGNDEVAELAHAFNGMAARLEQLHDLELQLRRQDRLSALGKAAAGIAHEVRNPLGVICTSTELIRSRYPLSERDQKLIDNVISEVRRIDRLIGEFLLYAKPAAVRLAPLVPSDLMAHLLRVFEPELARRKIDLEVQDHAGKVSIAGDADELQQAMFNVILNACDAMPDGGRLTIRLAHDHRDLRISFSDTGKGVPLSLGDRIFDPFVTTREQGTGLGLAKVRSVLDGHNGRVEFHNLAVGAMFEFIIPLSR